MTQSPGRFPAQQNSSHDSTWSNKPILTKSSNNNNNNNRRSILNSGCLGVSLYRCVFVISSSKTYIYFDIWKIWSSRHVNRAIRWKGIKTIRKSVEKEEVIYNFVTGNVWNVFIMRGLCTRMSVCVCVCVYVHLDLVCRIFEDWFISMGIGNWCLFNHRVFIHLQTNIQNQSLVESLSELIDTALIKWI